MEICFLHLHFYPSKDSNTSAAGIYEGIDYTLRFTGKCQKFLNILQCDFPYLKNNVNFSTQQVSVTFCNKSTYRCSIEQKDVYFEQITILKDGNIVKMVKENMVSHLIILCSFSRT